MPIPAMFWSARASGWARRSDREWARSRAAARVDRLLSLGWGTGRALDLGCGTGLHALEFAARGLTAVGMDYSEAMLTHARRAAGRRGATATFVRGDLNQPLPFLPASFEYAFSHMAFDHVRDAEAALRRVLEVLVPGGHFALYTLGPRTGPTTVGSQRLHGPEQARKAWRSLWRRLTRPYSMAELVEAGSRAGFQLADSDEGDGGKVMVTFVA